MYSQNLARPAPSGEDFCVVETIAAGETSDNSFAKLTTTPDGAGLTIRTHVLIIWPALSLPKG